MSETARIVCVCVYYDESPSWLGQHMASLAPVCTDFVYVDGGYMLFPGALESPSSKIEAVHEIHEMARALDRAVLHYRPTRPFEGNEVQKRNMSVMLARTLPDFAGDPESWILVADADTVATTLNHELPRLLHEAGPKHVVGEYTWQVTRRDWQAELDRGNKWAELGLKENEGTQRVRGLYRNLPGLRYGPAHWHVSCDPIPKYPDVNRYCLNDRVWLWNRDSMQVPALDLSKELIFEHRRTQRLSGRNEAAESYYQRRDTLRIEEPR